MIEMELTVLAIHGEGDRKTVNLLQAHRNLVEAERFGPAAVVALKNPDEPPDIIVVLRDATHTTRVEWRPKDWSEVERWKKLAGWDEEKRHWKTGATITVRLMG